MMVSPLGLAYKTLANVGTVPIHDGRRRYDDFEDLAHCPVYNGDVDVDAPVLIAYTTNLFSVKGGPQENVSFNVQWVLVLADG